MVLGNETNRSENLIKEYLLVSRGKQILDKKNLSPICLNCSNQFHNLQFNKLSELHTVKFKLS